MFERVASTAEPGSVDAAVIGQRGGRDAVRVGGSQERGDDVVAGDRVVCGAGQQVAGVVIEPVQDLHVGAVGEVPVGEVGLPGLVGLRRFEPDVRGPRPLLGLRGDQPGGVQDAADRGGRRRPVALAFQMPADGHGAGIQALPGQFLPQLNDPVADLGRCCGWIRPGSPRLRIDGLEPALSIPGQQPVQMSAGDPVLDRRLRDGELAGDDLQNNDTMLRHPRDCDLCRNSSATYHLRPMS